MKIIHPTDFSVCADQAGVLAMELARALGAELILLHVAMETSPFREGFMRPRELEQLLEEQRAWAARTLEKRAAETRARGISARSLVVTGAPAAEIVEAARREGAAFIVIGTHGRTPLERFLLGSVADRVVRTAACAVVTRRETDQGQDAPPALAPTGAQERGA